MYTGKVQEWYYTGMMGLSNTAFFNLIHFRCSYYQRTVRDKLLQYKHGIVILVALLAPVLGGICHFLTLPVAPFMSAKQYSISSLAILLVYFICGISMVTYSEKCADSCAITDIY